MYNVYIYIYIIYILCVRVCVCGCDVVYTHIMIIISKKHNSTRSLSFSLLTNFFPDNVIHM